MAFNLPTEEEAQAILADQRGIIMHEFLEDQARLFDNEGDGIVAVHTPGPFQRAVAGGDVELVRDMLAAGEDPNRLDETGECAINLAMAMIPFKRGPEDADTVRDVFACIELCLDAGALPDGPPDSRKRKTPLGSAVQQGRPEFVRLLLSAGADPNVPADVNGNTILHHAASLWGNRASGYEIVQCLLAAGADHAARSNPPMNATPFGDAVCDGGLYHRLWPLFLRAGAEIPNSWKRMQAYNEENGDLAEAQRYDYLATMEAAGGFKAYEKTHTRALAATLAKKFPAHIPEEIFPRVVAFWAHAGFYVSAAAVAEIEANAALADVIRRLRRAKSKLPSSRAAALEDVIARLERI